mgnify:CR=1 FL=1
MDRRLDRTTDENLRDVPCDPKGLKQYVSELNERFQLESDPITQVKLLGEMGVHLRSLKELVKAKTVLLQALKIVADQNLGIRLEIQQKIRLAHVLQWQQSYQKSNELFDVIVETCKSNGEATVFLDFALQHSGKNLFEQKRFLEALKVFEEALHLRVKRAAPDEQIESTRLAIAVTQKALAR